ncbi:MAG: 6-phosphofructokinase [Bacilli bacterium]|jgi:6-phosphofructokinase 1|nr:6-phosphofructokinase [Bacilli bacterium]
MVKRVGVLTSGGDAPGMNAAIRAIVRSGIKNGLEMFVIYEGYKGLIEGNIEKVDRNFVSDIINRGGTIIKSARSREFKDEAARLIGVKQLRNFGIDTLIVIGGDGTYMGAKKLSELGINCVGIPGTIDNDLSSSDFTIGFDTALNTICECVDKLRDTTASHQRCTIIEVMGNKCGDLALYSGVAEGVEMIITPEHPYTEAEIMNRIKTLGTGKKKHSLIIVSEKVFPNVISFAEKVTQETGFETRAEVLGRLQRGGSPSASDRILATRMGVYAIERLIEGVANVCVGISNGKIVHYSFDEAFALPRKKHEELFALISMVNR